MSNMNDMDTQFDQAARPIRTSLLVLGGVPLSAATDMDLQKLNWDLTILSGVVEAEIQQRTSETDLASTQGAS